MSGREWKPGDVAMVECSDGEWRRAICGKRWIDDSLVWVFQTGLRGVDNSNARPLVVIDPEDREQVDRLLSLFWDNGTDECNDTKALANALREFANPTPPKPAEPTGLGAVVEDGDGRHFVRQVDGWWRGDEPCSLNWAAVPAVRVLSEGVTL